MYFIIAEIPESSCPCENDVFDVTVDVDPAKSPMTKELVLDVFQNVYTSASTFMKKQGMDLKSWVVRRYIWLREVEFRI